MSDPDPENSRTIAERVEATPVDGGRRGFSGHLPLHSGRWPSPREHVHEDHMVMGAFLSLPMC